MKILISSMTFAPDHSGISLYATDFATYATEQGHDVTVVTTFSWYPKWKKLPEDKRKLFRKEKYKKAKILRGYQYVPGNASTKGRIIQEITFLFFALFNFIRAGRQEVIVVFTPPINLGILGIIFKKLWGAKLIINVQDLQLDAAKSLGMVDKLPLIDFMHNIEKFTYRHSDLVTTISSAMIELVKNKGVHPDKLYLWPNWIDVDSAISKGEKGGFREKFPQYENKVIIGYAGNVGVKQGLSTLIELSARYNAQNNISFLIIGEGGDLLNLKTMAEQMKIRNLEFIDFLSQEDYFNFLSDADLVFLSQKRDSGDVYFPSKLLGIMAKKKLIFVSADRESELYKVIEDNDLGMLSDFEDIDQMQICLDNFLENQNKFTTNKSNAFNFVQQFDRNIVLKETFEKIKAIPQIL